MSSGLMSCVRENSPPLEMAGNDSGALSLPAVDGSTSSNSAPSAEQQKRRRFHPLRNLRRMFRRRTLTSVDLSSPSSPSSSVVDTNQLSASSPSSPLQHQQQQQQQQQLGEQHLTKNPPPTVVGNTLSVPAHGYAGTSSSSTSLPTSPLSLSPSPAALAAGSQSCATNKVATSPNNGYNYKQHHTDISSAMSLSTPIHHQQYSTSTTTSTATGRSLGTCGGIGVLPGAFNGRTSLSGGYFVSKDKTTITQTSSSTVGLIGRETKLKSIGGADSTNDLESSREMTDSQRSLSEGRLVDSDFSRDGLSQSHDSVFSESATASSLSIVLKAELADVLRKRRNRPDASDEDLGLPRSPTTPQRREINNTTNQSEVSSLSLLSMSSTTDFDDELPSSTANHSADFSSSAADRTSSSISSKFSADSSSKSEDVELFSSNWQRLSHSAAKHKMAVRPIKKKGPTRHHRRTLESSVLPSTPEVNEDLKVVGSTLEVKDFSVDKAKSRSLPPGVNAKILEQHSTEMKQAVSVKRSKTEKGPSPNSTYAMRSNATKSSIFESLDAHSTPAESKDDESGFFRRFVYRNSKRGASKSSSGSNADKDDIDSQPDSKKPSPPTVEVSTLEKSVEYSQKVEETRKEIRREIMSEGKSALSAMLNTFILSPESEKMITHTSNENIATTLANKPKSGPAARQRYIPKDLSQSQPMEVDVNAKKPRTNSESSEKNDSHAKEEFHSTARTVTTKISKSYTEESFQSTSLIREITAMKEQQQQPREHFEKKPKIMGLSAFQQKISRSNDSFTTSSSTDSVEMFLGSDIKKRGKSVEKSKSFRAYTDSKEEKEVTLKNQMPSLPDLSQKNDDDLEDEKHLSLGFEINDNNLVKQKPTDLPLTHGIYTKNIILTTSKTMAPRITTKSPLLGTSACSKNISEIEDNIDKLVKSPFVSVLRKSATISDSMTSKLAPNVTISPMSTKRIEVLSKVESKIDRILSTDEKDIVVPPPTPVTTPVTTPVAPPPTPTTPTMPTTPTTPNKVQLREKSKIQGETDRKSLCERNTSPQTTASGKSNSFNRSRRSSSVIETAESNKGIPEFMKIQLNRVDPTRPKSNVVLSKNARESTEDLTRRFSNESVEISEVKPPTPEEDKPPMGRSSSITSFKSDESPPKSPVKNTADEENNILRSSETSTLSNNNNMSLHERRKLFLSEDKLKNDRRIEEMKLERKKSMSEEVRKCPLEEEPVVVVLRKKSFGVIQPTANNNKDDPTPELMKVFARRSLKIKDEDLPDPPIKKFTPSMDSDKENQSSSEEKLDKLSSIQPQQNGVPKADTDVTKNRNSLADFRNNKSQTLNNNGTPTKTFLPPMRLGGPFRNSTQGSPVMGKSISLSETSANNNNNNSLTNNNNVSKPVERQSLGPVVLSSSVPPSITLVEHNMSTTMMSKTTTIERSATMATMNRVESEFKGIHQRRAEWEKRAKEALK